MKIAVVDLETTGFNVEDCIIEVGVCELDLESGNTAKLLDMLTRDDHFSFEKHREAWVFKNTNIKPEDVAAATAWKNAARELTWIFDEYPVISYNCAFDLGLLRARQIVPKRELLCPMVMASPVLKIPGSYCEYKWPSMQEAWNHYFPGLGYIEQHRAYDDALHEALLIREMYRVGDYILELLE